MRKPNFLHIFFSCVLMIIGVTALNGNTNENVHITTLMDKITFRVDMRLQSVNGGAYIAGSFMDQVGLPIWSQVAMCDIGNDIYEISFTGIAPGLYQYKFLNGPGGWEFNGFGGPCTNPLDNENRWLNYGGGMHVEGPWCFSTCDLFCSGLGDPGSSDTNPPTIDEPAPANTSITCGDPLPAGSTLLASDGCDYNVTTMTGLPTDDISGLSACGTGGVIRTWEAEDCSGNTATVTQTITITDNVAPTIDAPVPANVTVQCGSLPPAVSLPASDGCDAGVTTTGMPTDDNSGLNPCGLGQIIRTWEASDCAGNMVSASQTITLEDNVAPTINVAIPADITVSCGNVPAATSLAASDACDAGVTSTGLPMDDNSGLNPCGVGQITRTWEVSDCSGNMVSASQTITVQDNVPPVLATTPSATLMVECGNVPAATAIAASDACDPTVTTTGPPIEDNISLNACGLGQIIRTWEVTDCSGNTLSVSQTITVEDTQSPVIVGVVPPNVTIECNDPLPIGMPLMASDGCDMNVNMTNAPVDDLSNIGICGTGQVTRTWEVSDCSGNTTTATQTITIEDTTPPIITDPIPANISVDCMGIPLGAPLAAIDGCDGGLLVTDFPIDDLSGLNNCGLGTVVRTWTATDCNGNSVTASQLITIEDQLPPTILTPIPADVTVVCGNVPAATPLAAVDDCDGTVVTTGPPTDDVTGLSACGVGVLVRTWTAMDCSGNAILENQVITIEDNDPPVLIIPADVSLDCNNIPTATAADASATDDCSSANVFYDGEIVVGGGCPYEIHRTWSATDECGNTSSATQIITVTDLEAPVLAAPPADVTVCQGALPAAVDLGWTDNCDGMGMVSPTDISDGMTDPESINRTWTYTDNCGNSASVSQTITVISAPAANAGNDQNLCEGETASLSGNVSGGFNSLEWTTSGDGIFQNSTSPNTDYTPGANDLLNGSATIYFTAQTNGVGACSETSDSLLLTFVVSPTANAGAAQTISCEFPQATLDGSASSSGNGFSYQWSGPGINMGNMNEQSPEVDQPGNYTLIVTEMGSGQNCTASATVEVFENTTLPMADAGADRMLTCTETSVTLDGSASSSGAGFEFLWTGPGITAANENLTNPTVSEGGIYNLIITNTANGCTASDETEVSLDGNLPTADAGPNQSITCDVTQVTLDGSNSSVGPGIEYQWFDPNGQPLGTGLTQNVSQEGIYSLNVNDTNNGCELTATVEVVLDNLPPLADAGQDTTLTCSQSSIVLGGNSSMGAELEYEWTLNGMVIGNNLTLTTGQSGVFTLTILNTGNGCMASDEVEVFQNADLPTAVAGPDQQLDCGNASVTLDGSGSSSGVGIEYEWMGPGFSATDISPQVSMVGLYYLTVTNTISDCSSVDSVEVTAGADLPIANAGMDTTLTCFAPQILLDGSNSTQGADINFAWLNSTGLVVGNGVTLLVNVPDVYTLNLTNSQNGCMASDQLTVGLDNLAPTASAGMDMQFTCAQTTIVLDGTGSSTGPQISYLWEGPGIIGDATLSTVEVVEIGDYQLTVTNLENGCSATDEVVVSQNPDVPTAFAATSQALTCLNLTVNLEGDASIQNATFTWSGPGINAANANEQNPMVSEPGIYTLIVNDPATGCDSPPAQVEVVGQQDLPVATISVNGNLDCQTATVLLDGSGSAQGDTITYQWLFGGAILTTGPSDTWLAENAGTYELIVLNTITGCQSSDLVEVMDVSVLPPVEITGQLMLNCFNETATLTEIVGSAMPNVSLEWGAIGGNILQVNQNEILVNAAGGYFVEVTDLSNGCVNADTVFIAEDFAAPLIVVNNIYSLGCSQSDVQLEVEVTAASNDLFYEWSSNGFVSNETSPTVTQAGQYDLVLTDNENGCAATASVEVTSVAGIENVFFTAISPTCFGGEDGILQIDSVAGLSSPYSFVLGNGDPVETSFFNGLAAGGYTLLVVDAEGCEKEVEFTLDEPPVLTVELGPNMEITLGESVVLSPDVSAPVTQYIWTNTATLNCGDCPSPIAQPTESTLYSLTVSNDGGCEATDEILISVKGNVDIFHPNAFSPNNDGINDVFTLFGGAQAVNISRLLVFDRWGAKVFDGSDFPINDVSYGWDGTHKGQLLDAGVYVFYAEIALANGEVVKMEGEVLLIR